MAFLATKTRRQLFTLRAFLATCGWLLFHAGGLISLRTIFHFTGRNGDLWLVTFSIGPLSKLFSLCTVFGALFG
jgi:hypothetical protein